MYFTAQRVQLKGVPPNESGINVFWHTHSGNEWANIDWNTDFRQLLTHVQNKATGSLKAQQCDIPPGGNWVLSHLDIIAPDDTSWDCVKAGLDDCYRLLPRESRFSAFHQGVIVDFNVQLSLEPVVAREFQVLRAKIEGLHSDPKAPESSGAQPPLKIRMIREANGIVFELSPEDRARVTTFQGPKASRLHVTNDILQDFERSHGQIFAHIMPLVTGLNIEQVARAGGVQVIDVAAQRIVWKWPL